MPHSYHEISKTDESVCASMSTELNDINCVDDLLRIFQNTSLFNPCFDDMKQLLGNYFDEIQKKELKKTSQKVRKYFLKSMNVRDILSDQVLKHSFEYLPPSEFNNLASLSRDFFEIVTNHEILYSKYNVVIYTGDKPKIKHKKPKVEVIDENYHPDNYKIYTAYFNSSQFISCLQNEAKYNFQACVMTHMQNHSFYKERFLENGTVTALSKSHKRMKYVKLVDCLAPDYIFNKSLNYNFKALRYLSFIYPKGTYDDIPDCSSLENLKYLKFEGCNLTFCKKFLNKKNIHFFKSLKVVDIKNYQQDEIRNWLPSVFLNGINNFLGGDSDKKIPKGTLVLPCNLEFIRFLGTSETVELYTKIDLTNCSNLIGVYTHNYEIIQKYFIFHKEKQCMPMFINVQKCRFKDLPEKKSLFIIVKTKKKEVDEYEIRSWSDKHAYHLDAVGGVHKLEDNNMFIDDKTKIFELLKIYSKKKTEKLLHTRIFRELFKYCIKLKEGVYATINRDNRYNYGQFMKIMNKKIKDYIDDCKDERKELKWLCNGLAPL